MADVTISVAMISDIPEQAAKSAVAVKGLAAEVKEAGGSAPAIGALGKAVDDVGAKTTAVSNGGAKHMTKAMKDLTEQGKKLHDGLGELGSSLAEKFTYPLQQATYALEAGTVATIAFGLATFSSLQQANLQLTAFSGNAAVGTAAYKSLLALRDPASMAALSGSYETLVNGGSSAAQALKLTQALAGAGAVSGGNSDALLGSASAALANISGTGGLITPSDLSSLQKAFPQIYSLLGKDTGQSASTVRTGALRGGETWQMPANFLSQLEATPQATGGLAAYDKTFAGQLGMAKTALGGMLAVVETPLATALGGAFTRMDTWATAVEGRFSKMSTTMGRDLSSGNLAGFSTTLANVLGDPKLASDIDAVTTTLESMAHIFTGSVVPAVELVAKVVSPALKGLGDILDIMAAHRAATEGLLITLGGFVVLTKVAGAFTAADKGVRAFQLALSDGGLLSAISTVGRAMLGLGTTEAGEGTAATVASGKTVAAAATDEAAVGGLAAALGPIIGALAVAGTAAKIADTETSYANKHHGAKSDAARIAAGMTSAGPFGAIQGVGDDVWDTLFGGGGNSKKKPKAKGSSSSDSGVTVQGDVNITLPGAGDPEKVANAIPRSLNAQVKAYTAMTARRTGSSSGSLAPAQSAGQK